MNTELNAKWVECINIIKAQISNQNYDTWFSCVSFVDFDGEKLTLQIPNRFVGDYIEENYLGLMTSAVTETFGRNVQVVYRVLESAEVPDQVLQASPEKLTTRDVPVEKKKTADEPFDSHLCAQYSFDNFIEGDSNRLARTVGLAISANPAKTFNPLFIFGPSGCGKTHLANAIGQRTKEQHPDMRVLYISAHLFYVQFANAHKDNKIPEFINFYQTIDVLIIDDIHELSGKTQTQNTFFHIFNHLHLNHKQLILTSDRSPSEIDGLEDRLLTRFKWGLQAEIEKPERSLRRAILQHRVKTGNLNVPEAVVNYIADNVNESIRDLEGIINSLNAYSAVYQIPINMKLVDKVLPKFVTVSTEPISIADIKRVICSHFNVKETELCSDSRRQPLSQIRQYTIYFASKLTNSSTTQIGQNLGGRSHSTIIHSIKQVENLIATDRKVRSEIEALEEEITH